MTATYRSIWGITIGDTAIWHGEELKIVGLSRPRYTQRFPGVLMIATWPSITLVVTDKWDSTGWINGVRREGYRFYWALTDREIMIRHNEPSQPLQLEIFVDNDWECPYPFRDGVDYTVRRTAFRCKHCGDFNGQPLNSVAEVAVCPQCGKWSDCMLVLVTPPRVIGAWQPGAMQMDVRVEAE